MEKLEKIKAQKAAYNKEKDRGTASTAGYPSTPAPVPTPKAKAQSGPTMINLEEADLSMLPGRKGRRVTTAEELEAEQREEDPTSPASYTVISP